MKKKLPQRKPPILKCLFLLTSCLMFFCFLPVNADSPLQLPGHKDATVLHMPHEHLPLRPSETRLLPSAPAAHYCPLAKDLKKQELRWGVGNTWVSYSESFSTEVTSFLGAQWVGVRVGKIICIYQGNSKLDFPIALDQKKNQIITEPEGQHWSALVQNYKFCQSTNVYDCPFSLKPAENTTNIYESIRYREPQINGRAHATDY